ncbi:MAG: hypothetical protein IBX60_08000 [Candidatus Aminicenantes bacterium]|nr:hypothetical protein [Candidatus Aminicenantes bacterium]
MRKKVYFKYIFMIILLFSQLLYAQHYNIFIHIESKFFEVINHTNDIQEKDIIPHILIFMDISNPETSRNNSRQIEQLKRIFNVSEIKLNDESKMTISWKPQERTRVKVSSLFELDGEEYSIYIIPEEINVKKGSHRFTIEIYKHEKEEKSKSLKFIKLITQKNIFWDSKRPLFIRFSLNGKIYFLSFDISVSTSQSIPF